jgi:hypothetical protein
MECVLWKIFVQVSLWLTIYITQVFFAQIYSYSFAESISCSYRTRQPIIVIKKAHNFTPSSVTSVQLSPSQHFI